MRARRKLINSKQSHLINYIFKQLMNEPNYPDLIFFSVEISSIQIKQYSLQKLFNSSTTNSLIKSVADKKVGQIFPFSKNLRAQLESKNLRVKNLQSELFWRFKCLTHLGFSFINLLNILRRNKVDFSKKKEFLDLYIHGVRKETLAISQTDEKLDNILSYFKNRNKTNKIMVHLSDNRDKEIMSDVCVVNSPFFGFTLFKIISIIFFYLFLAIRAFWDLVLGSGYLAFMSNEILLKKLALEINDKYIAREYAFSQSTISYFPAWLGVLSERGAIVTLYFYSHNLLPMQKKEEKQDWYYLYNLLNWPSYLVWDKKFGNEIKKIALNSPSIEISDPISLMDNNNQILDIAEYIAIFDVTPVRPSALSNYGIFSTIYDDEFSKYFFKKIISIAEKLGQPVVIKHKRNKTVPTSKRYRHLMNGLSKKSIVKFLNPDISARRVILNSKASISMPFTSTALIAKFSNKPTIYFDPFGDLEKNQLASLDVDIISDEQNLISWMKSLN